MTYRKIGSGLLITVLDLVAIGQGDELEGKTLVVYRYSKLGILEAMEHKEFHKTFKVIEK